MGEEKIILVAGYGAVGKALVPVLEKAGHKVFIYDPFLKDHFNEHVVHKQRINGQHFNIIHICFGCTYDETFLVNVHSIINQYNPNDFVIINSTVPIDMCGKIQDDTHVKIFHMPVRGIELYKEYAFKKYVNFIGPAEDFSVNTELEKYIRSLSIPFEWLYSAKESALGKIVGTSWYGMQIAFANQIKEICEKHNIDFHQAFTRSMGTDKIGRAYYRLDDSTKAISTYNIDRPVNIPGEIGGHCVMPNLKFIEKDAPNFVDWIEEMHWYMKDTEKLMEKELALDLVGEIFYADDKEFQEEQLKKSNSIFKRVKSALRYESGDNIDEQTR